MSDIRRGAEVCLGILAIGMIGGTVACSDGPDGGTPSDDQTETGGASGTGAKPGMPSEGPNGSGGSSNGSGGVSSGSGGSDGSGGGANEAFDCSTVSDNPAYTALDGPLASRGIAFDDNGLLVGGGGSTLFRSTRDSSMAFIPNITASSGQIAKIPNGDFLLAAGGFGLLRITESGAQSVFHAFYGFYAVTMGPNDMVYVKDYNTARKVSSVVRLDPDTAEASVILEFNNVDDTLEGQSKEIRVIDFSPEFDWMYLGTVGSAVWRVPLDEQGDPAGEPVEFLNLDAGDEDLPACEGPCTFEAIAVDVCGNVYLSTLKLGTVIRVSPDGSKVVTLWSPFDDPDDPEIRFAHGMGWGPHSGSAFAHDALYLATPYVGTEGGVSELAVGVPHRTWPGPVVNRVP